jgi:hypothetical protein
MNLGQSTFQDTFFVAGAQLTPWRQLRQIELELRSVEDGIKRASIGQRRTALKLAKLNPEVPEEALDLEEAQWDMAQQEQLLKDAESRKANFLHLKERCLASAPQEYWDDGFEAAEQTHWVLWLTKQLTTAQVLGMPDKNAMEQLLLMPEEAQDQVMIGVAKGTKDLMLRNAKVLELGLEPS